MNIEQKELISYGEPPLGSIYDQKEVEIVNKVLLESMVPNIGFYAERETSEFESEFSKLCNTKYAIAFNGAGGALDLLIRSLNINEYDEIVSCSLNFPGTHLAVIGNGAKLVLCEPDPATLNLDPKDLEKHLTKKTKAVLVTYLNGLAADMDSIKRVVENSRLFGNEKPKIIVDAARALGTTFKGGHVGKEAWVTLFSFQSKKVITTLGEGGMIVTDDEAMNNNLRQFRSFGKNENWGSNYKMTKIQAAVGSTQLQKLNNLISLRRNLAGERNIAFSKLQDVSIQEDTDFSKNSYYLYTLILPENFLGTKRDQLMKLLKSDYGIGTVVGNPPTYKLNNLIKDHTRDQILPIAESLGERIICVCIHPSITKETNQYIINSFIKAYGTTFK